MRLGFQGSPRLLLCSIWAVLLWSTAGVGLAIEAEKTVLVPPGSDSVAVHIGTTTVFSVYGPLKGQLWQQGEDLVYAPSAAFAKSGSDLAIVHLPNPGRNRDHVALRLRFVSGATAWDGSVAILGDLAGAPPAWQNWTVDTMGGALTVEEGLLGGDAYVFGTEDIGGPSIVSYIDDNSKRSATSGKAGGFRG